MRRPPRPAIGIVGALAALGLACGGPRIAMRDAPGRELGPPAEGRARVVLAMPGAYRDVVGVVDERGAFVAQLGSRTLRSLEVDPGERRFYAFSGASEYVVGGTLEAGRTYWVLAETGLVHGIRWVSWVPHCGEAEERLRGARAVEPDPEADRAAIDRQLGDVPQRILEADQELGEMSGAERAQRVLTPAPECGAGSAAPTPPEPAADEPSAGGEAPADAGAPPP